MMIKRGWIGTLIALIVMAGFSVYGWQAIPEGAEVPVHWGLGGEANRFTGKVEALLILPAFALGVSLFLSLIPLIDPRREHVFQSGAFYVTAWWGVLALMAMGHAMIVLGGAGIEIERRRAVAIGFSIFWILLGNVMGKVRSNFFLGIRTPWTLSSDAVWDRTHHWGGRLMVLSGLGLLAYAIMGPLEWVTFAILATVVAFAVIVVLLSFIFWKAGGEG